MNALIQAIEELVKGEQSQIDLFYMIINKDCKVCHGRGYVETERWLPKVNHHDVKLCPECSAPKITEF